MSNVLRSRKGFTLVELIVVIIIVGILASVAVPMMTANVNRAKRTEAIAGLSTIRTAERMVKSEHGSYEAVSAGGFNATNLRQYIGNNDLDGKYYNTGDYSADSAGNVFCANVAGSGGACNMGWNGKLNE